MPPSSRRSSEAPTLIVLIDPTSDEYLDPPVTTINILDTPEPILNDPPGVSPTISQPSRSSEQAEKQRIKDWVQDIEVPSQKESYFPDVSAQMDTEKLAAIRQRVLDGQYIRLERQRARAELPKYPFSFVPRFLRLTKAQFTRDDIRRKHFQEMQRRSLLSTSTPGLSFEEFKIIQRNRIRGKLRRHYRVVVEENYLLYAVEFWQRIEKRAYHAISPLRRALHHRKRRLEKVQNLATKIKRLFKPV